MTKDQKSKIDKKVNARFERIVVVEFEDLLKNDYNTRLELKS